jgi:hypothetical protein
MRNLEDLEIAAQAGSLEIFACINGSHLRRAKGTDRHLQKGSGNTFSAQGGLECKLTQKQPHVPQSLTSDNRYYVK